MRNEKEKRQNAWTETPWKSPPRARNARKKYAWTVLPPLDVYEIETKTVPSLRMSWRQIMVLVFLLGRAMMERAVMLERVAKVGRDRRKQFVGYRPTFEISR